MFQYLIVIWRGPRPETSLLDRICDRTCLRHSYSNETFCILASDPSEVLSLPVLDGAIMGPLFRRHGYPERILDLSAGDAAAIGTNPEEELTNRYWGSYVAVLSVAGSVKVLRDPSGGLPCEYAVTDELLVFGSHASLIHEAGFITGEVEAHEVFENLYYPDLPSDRTPLRGLRRLPPGNSAEWRDNALILKQTWNPWDFVEPELGRGAEADESGLRRAIQLSVSAWASCYPSALVGVSGGLDSSIVTSCLARSSAPTSCFTLATDEPLGDERHYARIIASAFDLPLVEEVYMLADVDIVHSPAEELPTPGRRAQEYAYGAALRRAAAISQSACFFTGNGGDSVFYMTQSARPLVDRFLREGLTAGVCQTAKDLSRITGAGLLDVFREALAVWRNRHSSYHWRPDPMFLSLPADHSPAAPKHPWLDAPPGSLPAKRGHIAMLLRVQDSLLGRDSTIGMPTVNPLMAQPIVEYCLGIPSWQMCADGMNRSMARSSFRDVLPDEIIHRRQKGGPDVFVARIVSTFSRQIRDRVMDGHLGAAGLLDLPAFSKALANPALLTARENTRILSILDAENWVRHWAQKRRSITVAAA